MEEDLTIGFVIVILNDETIVVINKPIGTDISIDLLKGSVALCNIHASFSDNIRMLFKSFPHKLYFLTTLVVDYHFKGPTLPIPCYKKIILSWFQQATNPYDFSLLILACNPTISIVAISCHQHQPCPDIVISVVTIVLLVFLNEADGAGARTILYCEFTKRHCAFVLFYDAA